MVQHVVPALPAEVDEILVRAVSVAAFADHRTVRKVARGERVRGVVGARIVRAFRERGFDPPIARI